MSQIDKALNKYLFKEELSSEDIFFSEPIFKNFIFEYEKIISKFDDKLNEDESPTLQNKSAKIKIELDKNFKALSINLIKLKETLYKNNNI